MASENYKTKIEYGVAAVVAFVGIFFVFQAFTIRVSAEAVGPRTMPLTLAISLISLALNSPPLSVRIAVIFRTHHQPNGA